MLDLLVELLRTKASEERILTKLWRTDPEGFGADQEAIGRQAGRSEGFEAAADLVEKYIRQLEKP